MITPARALTVLILVAVVAIAGWSRIRYVEQDGYQEPQRWRVGEHPEVGTASQ